MGAAAVLWLPPMHAAKQGGCGGGAGERGVLGERAKGKGEEGGRGATGRAGGGGGAKGVAPHLRLVRSEVGEVDGRWPAHHLRQE